MAFGLCRGLAARRQPLPRSVYRTAPARVNLKLILNNFVLVQNNSTRYGNPYGKPAA